MATYISSEDIGSDSDSSYKTTTDWKRILYIVLSSRFVPQVKTLLFIDQSVRLIVRIYLYYIFIEYIIFIYIFQLSHEEAYE